MGGGILLFFALVAVLAPVIGGNPYFINYSRILAPPSHSQAMGYDQLGRSVLSQMIWGTRTMLNIAALASVIAALVGLIIGALSGFFGGIVDRILSFVVNYFLTIPVLFLILVVVAIYGSNTFDTTIIIGLTFFSPIARQVRADFLTFKEREFVLAARSFGTSSVRLIFREILPNVLYSVIVLTFLNAGRAILIQASLAFLGLGDPQTVSWGNILYAALQTQFTAYWLILWPGLALILLVLAFNLIGDGLSDAFNVKSGAKYLI